MSRSDGYDCRWMRRAVRLAMKGLGATSPNPMVGAVIVKDGSVASEGWHKRAGEPHAEVEALSYAQEGSLQGSTLYVSLEPCSTWGRTPPCTDAILKSGIRRVVVGCLDPNPRHSGAGVKILKDAGLDVMCGVEEDACKSLNEAFFKWIQTGLPFTILKLASTLDGKIATASGSSQWITGSKARARAHKLRLWSDAALVGSETFRLDKPSLTVRNSKGATIKTPLRFVASSRIESLSLSEGWEAVRLDSPEAWGGFLSRLGSQSVCSLLIEGGGELAASALAAGAVDKVVMHYAPKLLGGRGSRPALGGSDPFSIDDAIRLSRLSIARLGEDFEVSGYIVKAGEQRSRKCSQG